MNRLRHTGLVWSLLACLVFMNGAMAKPSVTHAAKHENHQAGTHASGFCAWYCAAGHAIETSFASLESTFRLFDEVWFLFVEHVNYSSTPVAFLRGPPASSTS